MNIFYFLIILDYINSQTYKIQIFVNYIFIQPKMNFKNTILNCELLSSNAQFIESGELVYHEAEWAYLHSHKNREMSSLDEDFEHLSSINAFHQGQSGKSRARNAASGASSSDQAQELWKFLGQAGAHQIETSEPIENFSSAVDTEDPKFEKQKEESLKCDIKDVNKLCEASISSLNSFYHRKAECLESILASGLSQRDQYIPEISLKEFDGERHIDLALAPWHFQSLPGTKSAHWPEGLKDFVDRLEQMDPCSLWGEPLDTLSYGVEFHRGARQFILNQLEQLARPDSAGDTANLCRDLGLGMLALAGFAILSANNTRLIEALSLMAKIDTDLGLQKSAVVFNQIKGPLRKYLCAIMDPVMKADSFRYLDTTKMSGLFSIAKYVSFGQCHDHNTSITTDGEYLYLFSAVPQNATMYKIGTGATSATIAGKIYIEKKTNREGSVSWTYCQGKLFSRRVNEELRVLTLYDAETLNLIGDAKLQCGDIFSSSNCQQINRQYPILSDGKNLFIIAMKIATKSKKIRPEMAAQYQQIQEEKKKSSAKLAELEKESAQEQDGLGDPNKEPSTEKENQLEKKREAERKPAEIQARDEELLRSKVAAQRGRDGKRGRRGGREYSRGGAKPSDSNRRGAGGPNEDPHDPKLNRGSTDPAAEDPSSYKVCQFYLHEFKTTQPKSRTATSYFYNEKPEVVSEIERAFYGFFESSEIDVAYKDNNFDACEAVYQLVCDAEENRYKLKLPLGKSVLLCESMMVSDPSSGKRSGEWEVQVQENSILTPSCLQSGKWIMNGDQLIYHQNIMQEGTMIHIFSTNSENEKAAGQSPAILRGNSPRPPMLSQVKESQQLLKNAGQSLFSNFKGQVSGKEFFDQQLQSMPHPELFDFKQPELSKDRECQKQKSLYGDADEFGRHPETSVKNSSQHQQEINNQELQAQESSVTVNDAVQGAQIAEKDMFDEIYLQGTHCMTLKNQLGLDPMYKSTITYDHANKKYYVLVLANQQRYVAVVNDLHRFSENFPPVFSDKEKQIQVESMPETFESSKQFQVFCFKLLLQVESERFNLPWRWNQWSHLYNNAILEKQLRDQAYQDLSHQQLQPLAQQLKKNESQANLCTIEELQKLIQQKEKLFIQQRNKQIQKMQQRQQKVLLGQTELLRKEYGFEYDEAQGRYLQEMLDKKIQIESKHANKQKKPEETKVTEGKKFDEQKHEFSDSQTAVSPLREMAKQNLKNIYEKAKTLFPTAEKSEQNQNGRLKPSKFDVSDDLLPLSSSFHPHSSSAFGQAKQNTFNNHKYVAPIEHIIVHKELKQIYTFCQSGSIEALVHLFQILKHLDQKASTEQPEDLLLDAQYRRCILQQILIWSTFADQLASIHTRDQLFLNDVFKYLVGWLSKNFQHSDLEVEKDLSWKILFVGWEQLCRTTLQQMQVIKLALTCQSFEIEKIRQKNQCQGNQNEEKNQNEDKHMEVNSYSLCASDSKNQLLPLDLFFSRFFKNHLSFYDLEILNRSTVRSYVVLIETHDYQKAINYLKNIQDDMDLSIQKKEQIENNKGSKEITPLNQMIEPIRSTLWDKSPTFFFNGYQTVPISMQAVPSEIAVNESHQQASNSGFLGFAQSTQLKQGQNKKVKGAKTATQTQSLKKGFALEEIKWQSLYDGQVKSATEHAKVSSKLFSMPLSSLFTTDPFLVEGFVGSDPKDPKKFEDHQAQNAKFTPSKMIRKYDESFIYQSDPKEEVEQKLQKARESHRLKSVELIESFIDAIKAGYAIDDSDTFKESQGIIGVSKFSRAKAQTHQVIKQHNYVLVKSFTRLATSAQMKNLNVKTVSDLDLIQKVLKLAQYLLKQEISLMEQKKQDELRIISMCPLLEFVIQMTSIITMNTAETVNSNIPLIAYQLMPGLINVIALLKDAFRVYNADLTTADGGCPDKIRTVNHNLLNSLQALTNEGIDFSRERIFETPHPYPQNGFSQSETIEVPKAIGFIAELDKRCQAEHSADQLTMQQLQQCGSDQNNVFQINQNFATQIKLSTKPNTRQPYFLPGSRLKVEFRSHGQKRGHPGGGASFMQSAINEPGGQNRSGQSNPQNDARWGFRVIFRPIFSEPQNISLSGPVRPSQRKQIFAQLGGELNCHRLEVLLNSLVCLASKFSREMALIENFSQIKDFDPHSNFSEHQSLQKIITISSVTNPAILSLTKKQLFKGGIANSQLLIFRDLARHQELEKLNKELMMLNTGGKPQSFNYHEIIQQELRIQQELYASKYKEFISVFQGSLGSKLNLVTRPKDSENQKDEHLHDQNVKSAADEKQNRRALFIPNQEQWTQKIRELITVELVDFEQQQAQNQIVDSNQPKPKNKLFRIANTQLLDRLHSKVRELVQYPLAVKQRFFLPSAKKHQHEWIDLEKIMIVSMLYHTQSLHLTQKFVEIKVPNVRSSGGIFQYGTGLKSSMINDENFFFIDQLKLIGNQINDLLMWLILRVTGETDAQEVIKSIFEVTQSMMDQRIDKKMAEEELEKQEQEKKLEEEKIKLQKDEEAQIQGSFAEEAKEKQMEAQNQNLSAVTQQVEEVKEAAVALDSAEAGKKAPKKVAEAILVTGNKNRKIKRGKIVRNVIDTSKAKEIAKKDLQRKQNKKSFKDPADGIKSAAIQPEKIEEQKENFVEANVQQNASKYVDLTLTQINELKNQIEQKVYADLSSRYLGSGSDPNSLKPLCLLFNLKYNSGDPTETVRQIFKKIKGRISQVIDFDNTSDAKMLAQIADQHSSMEQFMESPYVEVCKDVKNRLLILLEVKPSIEYLNNVTKIDSSRCFSRYGSIKFSQKEGLIRGAINSGAFERIGGHEGAESQKSKGYAAGQNDIDMKKFGELISADKLDNVENSQQDDEHDHDELADIMMMNDEDDDGEKLVPLGLERSKSQQIGLTSSFMKKKISLKKTETNVSNSNTKKKIQAQLSDQESQGADWLEIHRKWKQWNRFHNQISGGSAEDRDLTSPFCSPLYSVLHFAKNSEIMDVCAIRQLLCEQQKRAAFRLFALKYQGKLYEILQGTPYQRFVWGNQSHSLVKSSLYNIEACGEDFVNQINKRSTKLVKQLMNYTVQQAESMKHLQRLLEKSSKQHESKSAATSNSTGAKSGKVPSDHAKKASANSQIKEGNNTFQKNNEAISSDSTAQTQSLSSSSEFQDRRQQRPTSDEAIPWQMKTVMHTLNDLRVLLSDPFTQAYILEALKEDQFKIHGGTRPAHSQLNQNFVEKQNRKNNQNQEQELGFQNIKQFLKALIQIRIRSNSSSPLAEQHPKSAKLSQAAFKVAKIVISQFVSDRQQIREAETSRILQEMLLEILVSHLEKVCGFDKQEKRATIDNFAEKLQEDVETDQSKKSKLKSLIDCKNLDEIVQLLKLLQEIMRISSDTQIAIAQHHMISQQMLETQSNNPRLTLQIANQKSVAQLHRQQSQFLTEGGTQVMRCAKLLSYLMIEYQVPVLVRQAIRCAKIFFFGLVDFEKLDLYEAKEIGLTLSRLGSSNQQVVGSSDEIYGELRNCCKNKFILASLKNIGQRISISQNGTQKQPNEGQNSQEKISENEISDQLEGSSLLNKEDLKIINQLSKNAEMDKIGQEIKAIEGCAAAESTKKTEAEKKYVVYANINSQIEDFTFLVTALYHWEELYPAISQTQPNDPKLFVQKSTKAQKKEKMDTEKLKSDILPVLKEAPSVQQVNSEEKKVADSSDAQKVLEKPLEGEKADAQNIEGSKIEKKVASDSNQIENQMMEGVADLFGEPINAQISENQKPQEIKIEEKLLEQEEKQVDENLKSAEISQNVDGLDVQKIDADQVKNMNDEKVNEKPQDSELAVNPAGPQKAEDSEKPSDNKMPFQPIIEEMKPVQMSEESKIILEENQKVQKMKKEAQEQCDKLLLDIANIEQNLDLLQMMKLQQKNCYLSVVNDFVKKSSLCSSLQQSDVQGDKEQASSEKKVKNFAVLSNQEALKILKESQDKQFLEKKLNKISIQQHQVTNLMQIGAQQARQNLNTAIKGAVIGNGNQISEGNLVPNKILIIGSQAQLSASNQLSQKISINTIQTAFTEILKHSQESIYDDDSAEEQKRKLNSRNFNERIWHHIAQAMCIASQLQQRYSVPVTEPLDHKQAMEFSKILQQAYKEQIEAVPINPFLKEEFHHKKLSEGKKLSQYFPLTLKNVMAGIKQPELPPGHAPPVVICQKTMVVSLISEKLSKEIEKMIENRSSVLKSLEKQPSEGFRLNICKNNFKLQGSSLSNCILSLIQFLREIFVGTSFNQEKKSQVQSHKKEKVINDTTSCKSSFAGFSESNQNFNQSEKFERQDHAQSNQFLRQQTLRQQEIMQIINFSLHILKTQAWKDILLEDKQIIIGLFAFVGGWSGFTKLTAGSQVKVEINGSWDEATVIDEGLGKRRMSVILNDDAHFQIVKVPQQKVKPYQTSIDKSINDKINFDDLCEAITFLHNQMKETYRSAQSKDGLMSLEEAVISEHILFQMLLKVSSKLNWNKIDQNSQSFCQFRKILIEVTSHQIFGETHEDKNEEFLEKQLIESWERIIDRNETKNLDFYSPKEFSQNSENKIFKDLSRNINSQNLFADKKDSLVEENQKLIDIMKCVVNPYIDNDYVQPISSYLNGLPEPTIKKNQKEAALKLLFFWEKNVLPTTREFVRSTFQQWEMNYYFEQIRHHLRQGDQRSAIADAMVLWENKVPNGVILPSENTDWTAKVADECIVDQWALAKISYSNKSNCNAQQGLHQSSSKLSQGQASQQPEASQPLILRLQNIGVQAIVIQIKLVDSRYNVALGEYYDAENLCSHFIWFPISHLFDLDYPLPPRSAGFTKRSLTLNYLQSVCNINSLYARKTLIKFFSSCHSQPVDQTSLHSDSTANIFKKDHFGELKLQELISWSVQHEFSNNPFNGWIQQLDCAIPVKTENQQNMLSLDDKDKSRDGLNLQKMIEQTSDQIIIEKLLKKEMKNDSDFELIQEFNNNQENDQDSSSNPLGLITDLFKNALSVLNQFKDQDETRKECDAYKTLYELADWISINWIQMSEQVSSCRAMLDLCKQNQVKGASCEGEDNQLISLHSVIKSQNLMKDPQSHQSIATLLMFHKFGCNLTPSSKIQFYSDPNQVDLVAEISAGTEAKTTLPPLLLNHSQIWGKVKPGSLSLLRREQQNDAQSSLPCAVFQIPKQWSVVCWLTETLSTSFLENCDNQIDLAKDIYEKLIKAIVQFYEDSYSPQMIKSQVLNLLTRLIRKLRYILNKCEETQRQQEKLTQEAHCKEIFVKSGFIKTILNDIDTFKKEEEKSRLESDKEAQILYSSFLQESVEFLMTFIIPINPQVELDSYKDILNIQDKYLSDLRDWLDPLMKASMFMHFFNNQIKSLPLDLLQEIHDQTNLNRHQSLEHILAIDQVPIDEELYPKAWLKKQIVKMCIKHHARILNPESDILFEINEYEDAESSSRIAATAHAAAIAKTEQPSDAQQPAQIIKPCYKIVVILDGWNHMTPLPDYRQYYEAQGKEFLGFDQIQSADYRKFINLVDSDTEEEQDEEKAAKLKKEEEEKKKNETADEIKPVEWACEACTFVSPMSDSICGICAQGKRPSMDQLIAEIKKQRLAEQNKAEKDKKIEEVAEEDQQHQKDDATIKHENIVRLKFLSYDLSKLIKIEQKRVFTEKKSKLLEQLREKEQSEQVTIPDVQNQAAEHKPLVEIKADEEKKHQESDAEKSDDDDDENQWHEESGEESALSGVDEDELDQKSAVKLPHKNHDDASEDKKQKSQDDLEAEANDGEDPRRKKLIELGYEGSILDADPQFAEALLASASLQEEEPKEQKRKQKEEEAAEKKKKEEEAQKTKKIKELELLKKEGLAEQRVEWLGLRVRYGMKNISADQNSIRVVFKFLQTRILESQTGDLSQRSKKVLKEIHSAFSEKDLQFMGFPPQQPYQDQLGDFGLTKDSIKAMDYEDFEQTCSALAAADIVLFFRFLESQGYDYWLQKQANPSCKPPKQLNKFNRNLMEKLKEFVEISYCEEKKVIQQLEPYQLRLLSKITDKDAVLPSLINEEKTQQVLIDDKKEPNDQQDQQISCKKIETEENMQPIGYFDDQMLNLNASQQSKHFWFNQVSQADINYQWALIKTFSKYFAITVPFINCSKSIADNPEEGALPITLSAYMSSLRNLCLSNTKYELKHLILMKTSAERDKAPVLFFERLKLHSENNQSKEQQQAGAPRADKFGLPSSGLIDNRPRAAESKADQNVSNELSGSLSGQKSQQSRNFMFKQAFEQMKEIDHGILRPSQPKGTDPHLSFEIYFKGEDVVGMGGPYRQFFSDVSQELQLVALKSGNVEDDEGEIDTEIENAKGLASNQYLDLLCASRNMLRNSEKGKENFVLNPQKVSSQDLSLYNFLGVLMGVCIRTNTNLAVNLPSLVWKQIVGQRLTIDDIQEFDDAIISELKEVLNTNSVEEFDEKFGGRFFTTMLSDLSTVPLEEGGSEKALNFANRSAYVRKTLKARMKECQAQCDAIKRGICQIIPEALLNMVSYQELEEWIYGKKSIDVELLKRHTEYARGYLETDKEVEWFWEILRGMTQEERRKFIVFCFAQPTIPPNDEEFDRRQLRFLIKAAADRSGGGQGTQVGDQRLPGADTCFFNFELPKYSSKEVMKRQILFAISFDNVSLNAEQENMDGVENASQRSRESRDSYE